MLPRQRCGPPSQRWDAGLLRVPGRRFPGGPCARDAVTAIPGQAASRPQGTCAWGGSALPLPGPDPGTQRSQGHSSLRSGDTKVRLRGGESGGRGQRPGSEARVRGQGPLPLCGRLLLRPWPGHPLALQSLDVTGGPSHPKPCITSSRVFCPEVARPVHFPGHGLRLRSLAGAASHTGGESPRRQLRGTGVGRACFVGDGVPWRA